MEIKKLLFVTKFEELWFDALNSLLDLRKAALNHVVFLNVIERDKVAMRRGTGYQRNEEIKLREKANIRFIDWAENLFEEGMEVGAYIVVGKLVPQVTQAAVKEEVDMVVIGRPKQGKLEQLYSGSDVSEIIGRAGTPVLVYKHLTGDGKSDDHPFARPLVALDWSPASHRAFDLILGLKDVVQEVNVVHVADDKLLKGSSNVDVQKLRKQFRQRLDDTCSVLEDAGITVKTRLYVGDTVTELETAARECKASMVITGTSAKGVWKERWIGSTPKTLAEKSVFPTLLIPPLKE